MVLMASQRTDIPAFYGDWLIRRLRAGFLLVRNPFNPAQIQRVVLTPDTVDCIVFLTKNPLPFLPRLPEVAPFRYCFQMSLTGYGRDIEPGLPDKKRELIPAFRELSRQIGAANMLWRYDPIFINDKYSIDYHIRAFSAIAAELQEHTEKVVISFVDLYQKTIRNTAGFDVREATEAEMLTLGKELAVVAKRYRLRLETCAETVDLSAVGVGHGVCVNKSLIERVCGYEIRPRYRKNLRPACHCIETIDAGTYNTCKNGCIYCYANESPARVARESAKYNPFSPILCDAIEEGETIRERDCRSLRVQQRKLWR
jgi:hypothetical protein